MSSRIATEEYTVGRAGTAAFDGIASEYDSLWTNSHIGRLQRDAVWRRLEGQFQPDATLLDVGCGTGEDSLHFMRSGLRVRAIDASAEMVRIASRRGINASVLRIEELERLEGPFDGAISDFGVINCVEDLDSVRQSLARLIRPGGTLALCVLGRFCAWETAWFLLRLEPSKAMRRWRGHAKSGSLGINVRFYSMSELTDALKPDFRLLDWHSIGLWVPPSYVRGLPTALLQALGKLDRMTARLPILRAMGDHRLGLFIRT